MMLIIHGFPPTTKYADVKDLIREICHIDISNFILDNLVAEDKGKKVRIGLSDETDGYRVLKCLNGFRMSGAHILRVESVKALKPENQRPVFQDPPRNIDYPGNQNYRDQNYHDRGPPGPNGPQGHGPSGPSDPHGPNGPMDFRHGRPIDNRYGTGPMDSRAGPNYPNHGPMDSRYHGPPDSRPDSHGPMGPRSGGPSGPMDRPGFQNVDRSGPHGPNDRYSDDRMGPQYQNRFSKPDQMPMDRHGGPDMSQNQGPRSFGPNESMRNQNWQSNVSENNNQWSGNQGPPMQQNPYMPQQNMNPGFNQQQMPVQQDAPYNQGRPPQDQNYGYPRKNLPGPEMNKRGPVPPEIRPGLRAIEIVDSPQYQRDKPITIMKDNFQGPTQYNPTSLTPSQGQIQPQPWASHAPQQKPYEKSFDKRPDIKPIPERDNRKYSPTRDTRSPPQDIRGFTVGKGGPNRRPSPLPRHTITGGRNISPPGRKISPSGQGRHISPSGRRISPSGRRISPPSSGRRMSPPGRRISPPSSGRRISPSGRRISPSGSGRRVSPPGRRISPSGHGRRISPTGPGRRDSPSGPGRRISPSSSGRRMSPGRRISPSGRRISPSGHRGSSPGPGRRISPRRRMSPGRRISPSGRRISPSGRHIAPSDRRASPGRRFSPERTGSGRNISPGRRISPSGRRMSPGRHMSPGRLPRDEQRQPSPSMMSYNYREGDRRINVRTDLHRFSPKRDSPSRRSPGRPRFSPTRHQDKPTDKYDGKPIRPAYEPSGSGAQTQYSGGYRPSLHENVQYPIGIPQWQKDKYAQKKEEETRDMPRMVGDSKRLSRSPGRSRSPKDRFRRHSPSPRSPRRSWALEKRRSPEMTAPPPPVWPGQEPEKPRSRFDESVNKPVWERPDDRRHDDRRPDDRRSGDHRPESTEFKEKFTRSRWEEARDSRSYHTEEIKQRDDRRPDRQQSPREDKPHVTEIDRDFQDVYKRALEFRKKAEEMRKSTEKKREDYHPDRHDKYAREDSPGRNKLEAFKRDLEWKGNERGINSFNKIYLPAAVKVKRDKAIDEIAEKILSKHDFRGDQQRRISEELKLALAKTFNNMFGVEDVSYIELVIKFRARYSGPDEDKILMDVLSSLPSHYQAGLKRKNEDPGVVPTKTARHSPPPAPKQEVSRPKLSESVRWDMRIQPPKMADMATVTVGTNQPKNSLQMKPAVVPAYQNIPQAQLYPSAFQHMQINPAQVQAAPAQIQVPPVQTKINPVQIQMPPAQMQVTPAQMQQFQASLQMQNLQSSSYQMMPDLQPQVTYGDMEPQFLQPMQADPPKSDDEGNILYLCQDDFEPFATHQAECLKKFLIHKMVKVTEANEGWAPDFTLRGLNTAYRYEVSTRDPITRNWLRNLDFSEFEYFNVLVYTKEELWYERAAIWLPGHSRFRSIEPLQKLALQNKHLDGVNVGKWKFVKKVITEKGTRLYVDMPPSAARALERYKMMLSYELSKVTVILKAVAVDKDSFDAGLKHISVRDPVEIMTAVKTSPMPTLGSKEHGVVKISLNGVKTLSIEMARKIKEIVIYHLFKYLQKDGKNLKTDFIKYGYCQPDSLGIVPENDLSRRWLLSRHFGKLKRHTITVVGSEDGNTKFFKMYAYIAGEQKLNRAFIFERLKQSNLSVKGMHFNLWKPVEVTLDKRHGSKKVILELEMDLDSVDTLSKMNYVLDYVGESGTSTANFRSDYTFHNLEEKIRKFKAEQQDSYDVANMDLDSGSDSDTITLD